jgi:di/tricarboxylate transporter
MNQALTPEIIVMFVLLAMIILIFATEILRMDTGAFLVLILMALAGLVPGLTPLLPASEIFSGFSSNAVIAIMAVMILSASLEKTGVLNRLAAVLIRFGGHAEKKLNALTGVTVGLAAGFMQNTGAAALFIPVVSRIAAHSGVPFNRLLLPMAFCAIVGGTLTAVGSSPLILLHDLLPSDLPPLGLFEVTPVGIGLLTATVLYFFLFGDVLLPPGHKRPAPITPVSQLKSAQGSTKKILYAAGCMALAIALVLLTDLPLAVSLVTGALGMILARVITIEEVYSAVNWPTVFLLACLIPVGVAVETTGTAAWMAQQILSVCDDQPVWLLQTLIAVLTTAFAIVITNVGATILLVPLAVNIALAVGADPRLFALTAAIAASNAFILPTHPVNTLIIGPGKYRVKDFTRAGVGITVIYLAVSILILNWIF